MSGLFAGNRTATGSNKVRDASESRPPTLIHTLFLLISVILFTTFIVNNQVKQLAPSRPPTSYHLGAFGIVLVDAGLRQQTLRFLS